MNPINLMRRCVLLFFLCNAFAVLWVLTGCDRLPQPPTRDAVFAAFGIKKTTGSDVKVVSPTSLPPLNLYIDDSESMKGFVTDGGSTYEQVLRRILEKAATARYALNTYKFSSKVTPLGEVLSSHLVSPSFYSGAHTPLAALLNGIANDTTQLSVVVSDLVQSEKEADQVSLVKAFQKAAAKRPEVLLMAFRSSFHGRYFIETPPNGWFDLDPRKDKSGQGRPFYLLVVAPSKKAIRQLDQYVLSELGEDESFRATEATLVVNNVKFAPPEQASQAVWHQYSQQEELTGLPDSPYSAVIWWFYEPKAPQGKVSQLRLRFTAQNLDCVRSVADFGYRVERITFRQGNFEKPTIISDLQPTAEKEKGGSVFTVTYPFPRPSPHTWDAYRIRMKPGEGNPTGPDWVSKWSTNDDRSESNANRTLHIDLLVEAMVRAITENMVFSDQFILLGRGD